MNKYDVIIVGGGVSGMISAINSKSKNILIIEKSPRVGKKLLATGNGKCNLLNKNLSKDYYNNPDFVENIFEKYDEPYLESFYDGLGLCLRFDSEGRGYPMSESASTVLDILRRELTKKGVDILTDNGVNKIVKNDGLFTVYTDKLQLVAKNVLFCTGSNASFGYDSLDVVKDCCDIVPFTPALCPILSKSPFIKGLNGVRVKCDCSLYIDGILSGKQCGEVLFKSIGLSGIAIFNLSSLLARKSNYKSAKISLNLFEKPYQNVYDFLSEKAKIYRTAYELLQGVFHKMIVQQVLNMANVQNNKVLSDDDIKSLAKTITNFEIVVDGLADKSLSQVMAGGVSLLDINKDTLESKSVSGLYFAGEALNIDGLSGGYNLMWAVASALCCSNNF